MKDSQNVLLPEGQNDEQLFWGGKVLEQRSNQEDNPSQGGKNLSYHLLLSRRVTQRELTLEIGMGLTEKESGTIGRHPESCPLHHSLPLI